MGRSRPEKQQLVSIETYHWMLLTPAWNASKRSRGHLKRAHYIGLSSLPVFLPYLSPASFLASNQSSQHSFQPAQTSIRSNPNSPNNLTTRLPSAQQCRRDLPIHLEFRLGEILPRPVTPVTCLSLPPGTLHPAYRQPSSDPPGKLAA